MRKAAGQKPGKSWEQGQLMGALQVDVPIDEVAAAAAKGRNAMLGFLGGIFVFGFSILFVLIQKTIIQPVRTSVLEVESFSDNIQSVVGCSRNLLLGADDQVVACKKAKIEIKQPALVGSGGPAEEVRGESADIFESSLNNLEKLANDNANQAGDSAFHCIELESSFNKLKQRLQKILGRS